MERSLTSGLKVAHWCQYGPNQCGLYHTAKDMIWGERQIGIDAQMINSGAFTREDGKKQVVAGLINTDGWLTTVNPGWAKDADVFVLHSAIPDEYLNMGKPVVVVCHGRPESSFEMERNKVIGVYTSYYTRARSNKYRAFVTLWPEYMHTLGMLLPKDRLSCVTAPVNLEDFSPFGDVFDLGERRGNPNILVADMWRYDHTPFNVIQGVSLFQEKYCPDARLHVVGLQDIKSNHIKVLVDSLKQHGCLGNVAGGVRNMAEIYRSCDILVTPHVIATRVVREALACGLSIVAGTGNAYTNYMANPVDVEGFAEAIYDCWENTKNKDLVLSNHNIAKEMFNPIQTGKDMKDIFEKVLAEKPLVAKSWSSDDAYLKKQKQKLKRIPSETLKQWDEYYYQSLIDRMKWMSTGTVLCLGARQGTEVRAFRDLSHTAIGIDLNPGENNPYVMYGDFHDLKFSDNSFDHVFTNSLDHCKDLAAVLAEVKRVLWDGGCFIIDINEESNGIADKWASLFWSDLQAVIDEIEKHGFRLESNTSIDVNGLARLTNQLVFVNE